LAVRMRRRPTWPWRSLLSNSHALVTGRSYKAAGVEPVVSRIKQCRPNGRQICVAVTCLLVAAVSPPPGIAFITAPGFI
jgi:hypothetical protein